MVQTMTPDAWYEGSTPFIEGRPSGSQTDPPLVTRWVLAIAHAVPLGSALRVDRPQVVGDALPVGAGEAALLVQPVERVVGPRLDEFAATAPCIA